MPNPRVLLLVLQVGSGLAFLLGLAVALVAVTT